jgi:hypothetical protein
MGTQYLCGTEQRRQAIQADGVTLNGVDYLEVLDTEAPDDSPRQRTLLVRCFRSVLDLGSDNIEIVGLPRSPQVGVCWALAASQAKTTVDVPCEPITSAEEAFFGALPDPDSVLVVRTDLAGNFSTYILRLLASSGTNQATAFDPQLSEVAFSFKVECPSDFDCQVETVCPPDVPDEPGIDYLAKDYASFRQLMLDRLAVLVPEWRERNPADMGVALVEALAYAADYVSYYQDAVATEAYLGTARHRVSVRRHARLLDYPMHDGCNARAWVQVQVDGHNIRLEQGTKLLTRIAGKPSSISPDDLDVVLKQRPLVFETMHTITLYEPHNSIPFYAWSEEECCLPKGATRATLRDAAETEDRLRLRAGDVLVFVERIDPGTGREEDADPTHRHAVRLTHVEPEATVGEDGKRTPSAEPKIDPLTGQQIVEIEWMAKDALPFPLCISLRRDGEPLEAVEALGNILLADHGHLLPEEVLEAVPESERYRPRLQETGITHTVPYAHDESLDRPTTGLLAQDPHQALPDVTLDGGAWKARRDLLSSGRLDPHFVVELENDGRAYLRFGDGKIFGQIPPIGHQFGARYRVGNGTSGNVGAEAIAHVVSDDGAILKVRNPLPAQGGTDPEPLEQVRQYAPQAFRTQERAVTEADYAAVVQRHPAVQRAAATRRWTGSWYTMFITVDRKGGRPVDAAFEHELRTHVERFRLTGHDVEVDGPRFAPLDIAMTVCVADGYYRSEVKRALLETFSSRDLPDGSRGFFHPDNYTFGQPVYLSQVVAAAMRVPGVAWVDVDNRQDKPNRFHRFRELPRGEFEKGKIEMDRLEIALLDNDPSTPENGRIEFIMEGGL